MQFCLCLCVALGEEKEGGGRRPSDPLVTPRVSFMFLHEPLLHALKTRPAHWDRAHISD